MSQSKGLGSTEFYAKNQMFHTQYNLDMTAADKVASNFKLKLRIILPVSNKSTTKCLHKNMKHLFGAQLTIFLAAVMSGSHHVPLSPPTKNVFSSK